MAGLKRICKRYGGMTVTAGGKTVKYDREGKIIHDALYNLKESPWDTMHWKHKKRFRRIAKSVLEN